MAKESEAKNSTPEMYGQWIGSTFEQNSETRTTVNIEKRNPRVVQILSQVRNEK
ncbi:MAG TPA: hypothetical protein VE344_09190 [Methylomirabilota bacterium]|nr:hypothetical protein [Methylomirabilota bacterium]